MSKHATDWHYNMCIVTQKEQLHFHAVSKQMNRSIYRDRHKSLNHNTMNIKNISVIVSRLTTVKKKNKKIPLWRFGGHVLPLPQGARPF